MSRGIVLEADADGLARRVPLERPDPVPCGARPTDVTVVIELDSGS
ncbi:hypothetical protein [Mycolicibacterium brisbanense]|uniref:Uncharacterized protein n=1 Tax=Mycolicibacterium brisbanense TaxID=146020 RepID=A0A100W524_9MYCO|nr:hypothetical protein [Mycolicibacterium brisbanense]MCV7160380.1 hypothetical protein [Mycolicibacterium brisbanense]GAS91771.1 uncharacterized protein RMCB_5867 [Mycolicibacterium brisbanense]